MGFGLLLPAALAALVALALPLLLHLARRSEQRPTPFAALRWLYQRPRPRQRLRVDDWPLLLLRLLLLALLALWLAQPVWREHRAPVRVVAVVPGVVAGADVTAEAGSERRWLVPGFPLIDAAAPVPAPDPDATLSSLVRELDADLPAEIALTIVVPPVLDTVDAQRLVLGRAVDWHIAGAASDAPTPVPATPDATPLAIRHDGSQPDAVRILRATALAWQPGATPATLDLVDGDGLPDIAVPLAWMRAGPMPDALRHWIAQGGTALLGDTTDVTGIEVWAPLWRDADGVATLEAGPLGDGRVVRFTRPLAPASLPAALDGAFPKSLRAAMRPAPAPTRVDAASHAPTRGRVDASVPRAVDVRDLRDVLALLIGLVFLLERGLATTRRRSIGA